MIKELTVGEEIKQELRLLQLSLERFNDKADSVIAQNEQIIKLFTTLK